VRPDVQGKYAVVILVLYPLPTTWAIRHWNYHWVHHHGVVQVVLGSFAHVLPVLTNIVGVGEQRLGSKRCQMLRDFEIAAFESWISRIKNMKVDLLTKRALGNLFSPRNFSFSFLQSPSLALSGLLFRSAGRFSLLWGPLLPFTDVHLSTGGVRRWRILSKSPIW